MRSRLEATAAGMLDEIGIEWEYEPVCFADGRRQYLPDFQLWPTCGEWRWFLEIKPPWIWEAEGRVCRALIQMQIIRASYADAILILWVPDATSLTEGQLMYSPSRSHGWDSEKAEPFLFSAAMHVRGDDLRAERSRVPRRSKRAVVVDSVRPIRHRPIIHNDLALMVVDVLGERRHAERDAKVGHLRTLPVCAHGVLGGDQLHPVGGEALCPRCRYEFRHANGRDGTQS